MFRLAVLVSGGGTNLQAIIDACEHGEIEAQVAVVISNRKDAYALERAQNSGIDHYVCKEQSKLLPLLESYNVDLIVLAGYLKLIPQNVIDAFPNRIINIHPSLIPSFCGKGYYGIKVHEAAIKKGVKVSGATVHFVNENFDDGEIIMQEAVPVLDTDTPESLQARVLEVEHQILPQSIQKIIDESKREKE